MKESNNEIMSNDSNEIMKMIIMNNEIIMKREINNNKWKWNENEMKINEMKWKWKIII